MLFAQSVDPWKFQWHPEVWVLVGFLTGAFIYMVRVIGPKAVPPGQPVVSRGNVAAFIAAMAMLWVASDYPIHDIGEDYLYSVHMLQHMMLSYFLPPLVLLATPEWLLRVLVGDGRLYRVVAKMCRPVVAAVVFNVVVVVSHIPGVVNASVANGPLHYSLHFLVVLTSLLMWMPVVGPFPEFRISPLMKCAYLFAQSLVPTIPAAWLTFAEGPVYDVYDQPIRVWGVGLLADQQVAGAIMKTGGTIFLWTIIVFIFFRRFAIDYEGAAATPHDPTAAAADPRGVAADDDSDVLTTEHVEREFARVPATPDD